MRFSHNNHELEKTELSLAADNLLREAANITWFLRAIGYSVFALQRLTKKHLASDIENKTHHIMGASSVS